ncbi:hypothetical protein ACJO2E_08165 [Marinobacter sp. M1N3S26]|uniref:hypothetical protein n=1 Tax=unclassified Marinobacter TaxID=83889 RepID=UPI00387AC24B
MEKAGSHSVFEPVLVQAVNNRQRLFVRYFLAILIDLVVLNLFNEYSDHVRIDSFTTSLFAAVLLQVLLRLTIVIEHRVAAWFRAMRGGFAVFMRYFSAWLLLFGSKFVILEALSLAFGDGVQFLGRFHGVLVLILVIVTMLLAEELVARIYRWLGESPETSDKTNGESLRP